jgi:ribulose-phosphate 3-epimerase
MCAKFTQLEEYIERLNRTDIDFFHIDIMDGVFAPNFMFSVDDVKTIREMVQRPLDFHLMVTEPFAKLDWFEIQPRDRVAVHLEALSGNFSGAKTDLDFTIEKVKQFGAEFFLALEIDTEINQIVDLLPKLDGILVMAINVGFAGRPIIPQVFSKVAALRERLDAHGFPEIEIECDGSMSIENARKLRAAGASSFVLGTASIFNGNPAEVAGLLQQFRAEVG